MYDSHLNIRTRENQIVFSRIITWAVRLKKIALAVGPDSFLSGLMYFTGRY